MKIPRENYKNWLDEFRHKKVIKVLTGMRRSGKSTILSMYIDSLLADGISPEQIVSLNFEQFENEALLDPRALHDHVLARMVPGRMLYVFLDEIQHVAQYEKVVDSLYVRDGIDLYITGSTADLLSSEMASRLTGRYVEINVLPLSFREYVHGKDITSGNARQFFNDYVTYGGLPGAQEFANGSPAQREYVESVFKSIIEKDVIKRGGKSRFAVEQIIRYLSDAVGCLTTAKRIADRMDDKSQTTAYNTVISYLERLTDCYFVYRAPRFDVIGGENLKLINKYYLTDFGFRHYILGSATLELSQLIENAVYFEFLHRRFKVATGKVENREVDFVLQGRTGDIRYVQVAVSVSDQAKLEQELAAFRLIRDNYPKYILTLDEIFVPDHAGVKTINLLDFLLGKSELI